MAVTALLLLLLYSHTCMLYTHQLPLDVMDAVYLPTVWRRQVCLSRTRAGLSSGGVPGRAALSSRYSGPPGCRLPRPGGRRAPGSAPSVAGPAGTPGRGRAGGVRLASDGCLLGRVPGGEEGGRGTGWSDAPLAVRSSTPLSPRRVPIGNWRLSVLTAYLE